MNHDLQPSAACYACLAIWRPF